MKIKDISHINAAGDYSEVFTVSGGGGKRLLVEKSPREWEERLPEKHFLRIHRQTIVNLEEIEKTRPWFNVRFKCA